jgi:hypothetical protein
MKWWNAKSLQSRVLPGALVGSWWLALRLLGMLNTDHLTIGFAILALAYLGRATESFLKLILPAILTVIIYDSKRGYSHLIRSSYIRVQEPYLFDKFFFGISTPEGVLTPNEWLQKNTHWLLDLVTGFFYLGFVAIFVLMGIHFRYLLPRLAAKARTGLSPEWIRARAHSMFWAFFWVNMLGYSTYHWYPAAPPWYVTLHGLGPADLSTRPNPAGCIRFDQLLGTNFFTAMYDRSADVFGAIPSLHVSYPLLAMLFAFELRSLRIFGVFFYAIMCFAAVYLNHHYIIDLIWGSAYTVLVYVIMKRLAKPVAMPSLNSSLA